MEGGHWALEGSTGKNWPVQERDFDEFPDDSLTYLSARREGGLWSSSELDSDVEDAIYAQIYFDKNDQEPDNRVTGETGVGSTNQSSDFFSISLRMSDQEEEPTKRKRKRKRSRRRKRRASRDGDVILSQDSTSQDLRVDDRGNKNQSLVSPDHSELGVKLEKKPSKMRMRERVERRRSSAHGVRSVPDAPGDGVVLCLDGDESRCDAMTEKWKNGGSSHSNSDHDVYIVKVEGGPVDRIVISSGSEDEGPGDGLNDGSDDGGSGGELSESSASGGDVQGSDMELCSEGEVVEDTDDPWHIIRKDVMGRDAYERRFEGRERAGRYYAGKFKKCNNCKQKGHMDKDCPHPKRHRTCYFCAGLDHMISSCPHDLCPYCYRPKHKGRSCGVPWASPKTQCNRCFMTGHHASICPDQWRQFHNTTYSDGQLMRIHPAEQRQHERVFCYNCAQRGHFGFECTKARMRFSPLPHLPLIAKYDAVWPLRQRIHSRGFSSAVEIRGLTVTAKRGLLKRSVSYDPQLPPSKKGRYLVHPNSSGKGSTNEYDSRADLRSFLPPPGSSRFSQPAGQVDLRNVRRLSAPLSRSSLDSPDRPLLDRPPGFHDSFRPIYLPHPEPHLPPYNPAVPPIARHELDPPRKSLSEPRPPSTRHEEHYPREPLPPYPNAHHKGRWDNHSVEEDYPRTPFRQPKMNQPLLSRTFDTHPLPPKYRRSSDVSERRFPDHSDRRFSDVSDRRFPERRFSDFSDRLSIADFERSKPPDQRRHSTYSDGVVRSERGFRGTQHIARVARTVSYDYDSTKRRNSLRY